MSTKRPSRADRHDLAKPLAALTSHLAAFEHHLVERGHAAAYIAVCKRSVEPLATRSLMKRARSMGVRAWRFWFSATCA